MKLIAWKGEVLFNNVEVLVILKGKIRKSRISDSLKKLNVIKDNSRILVLALIALSILVSSGYIYHIITIYHDIPFPWDPAARACEGLIIANDLKAGDIISFFADTYRQGWWPFFHSWLLAPAFILFGNTNVAARSVSLICFILFIPTIYLISIEMSEKRGHWMGLIITYLTLTVWPFLSNAAICMAEIPGLLMTFITLLFYLKAIRLQKPYLFVCSGILMAFTLFTKWHHGVFVVGAIFLTQFSHYRKVIFNKNYWLFSPFLVLMVGWFIHPQHILNFYEHSTFQPHFFTFFSLENWLYYPNSFFRLYHRLLIVAVIMAICFLYSLREIKDPKVRLFATHFLIGIILLTLKLDNRHRYIITIVPSIWILGSYQFVEFIYYLKNRLNNKPLKIVLASITIVVFSTISFSSIAAFYKRYPNGLLKVKYWCDEKPNKAYEFISTNVGNHNQVAVFGSWDYYNSLKSSTIRWHIGVARNNDMNGSKIKKEKARYYFRQLLRNRDKESYGNFINFLENKDITVHEYHLLSFMKNFNPEAYKEYRGSRDINPFSDKIADVTSLDSRITCLITIHNEREVKLNNFSDQFMSKQNGWAESVKERFSDLGIIITIYERKVAKSQISMALSLPEGTT